MNPKTETRKKFLAAPEEIQEMVTSLDTLDQLGTIGKKYNLTGEQINKLGQVFTSVLIGITPLKKFSDKIFAFLSIPNDSARKIADEIDGQLFSKVRISLEKLQSTAASAQQTATPTLEKTKTPEIQPDKEKVLPKTENSAPAKPAIQNPAGKNPVLDAQRNLPEQEKKILIPKVAVPSRGPLLGNIETSFAEPPKMTPVPTQSTSQPSKPPQAPQPPVVPQTPKAPAKYTVDPYREPLE
jgi:hypothetical protein